MTSFSSSARPQRRWRELASGNGDFRNRRGLPLEAPAFRYLKTKRERGEEKKEEKKRNQEKGASTKGERKMEKEREIGRERVSVRISRNTPLPNYHLMILHSAVHFDTFSVVPLFYLVSWKKGEINVAVFILPTAANVT